jgi:LmbE family N-acetylglucosaminyl deacetylase
MATLVLFHAHPDDEAIASGGTMRRAADAGHRVVLVVATRGERGEPREGVLADGEQLWERRISETMRAAELLGVARVEFLGYVDSGMVDDPANVFPYSFASADVEQAAVRLAAILSEESADVLTVYDDHGGYGHPDHVQVHRVGHRAAQLAGVPKVFEVTMNRDAIRRQMEAVVAAEEAPDELALDESELEEFGMPEAAITHAVDVRDLIGTKRAAMQAHESQIGPDSWFLQMDDDMFAGAFGTEWYVEHGAPRAADEPFRGSLFGDS